MTFFLNGSKIAVQYVRGVTSTFSPLIAPLNTYDKICKVIWPIPANFLFPRHAAFKISLNSL